MSLELEDFELALKKMYSSEVEFKHSDSIQSIINYTGLSFSDIKRVWKGGLLHGPRNGFLTTSFSFDKNVATAYNIIVSGNRKFKFILCEDKDSLPSVTRVVAFVAHRETYYRKVLERTDRLKAFL